MTSIKSKNIKNYLQLEEYLPKADIQKSTTRIRVKSADWTRFKFAANGFVEAENKYALSANKLIRRFHTDVLVKFLGCQVPPQYLIETSFDDDGTMIQSRRNEFDFHPFIQQLPKDWEEQAIALAQEQTTDTNYGFTPYIFAQVFSKQYLKDRGSSRSNPCGASPYYLVKYLIHEFPIWLE